MMLHEISPDRLDIAAPARAPQAGDYVLWFDGNRVAVGEGDAISLHTYGQSGLDADAVQYLFRINDTAFFETSPDVPLPAELTYVPVRELRLCKPMTLSFAATLGFRLHMWRQSAKYCGCCGTAMRPSETERAMVCPNCGFIDYPRIAPAVIVLIRSGERTLLTRYQAAHSSFRRYALVAGYCEWGETPEQTVAREVYEEVGLHVRNIRYYKSQPWPLSGSLLLGFVCDLDGDDTIRVDEHELSAAEWVARGDMPDRSDDISLTSELMEGFRMGKW